MAKTETFTATKYEAEGPWLIDAEQLASLAALLDQEWQRLVDRRDKLIDQEAAKEVRRAEGRLEGRKAAQGKGDVKPSKEERAEIRKAAKDRAANSYEMRQTRSVTLYLDDKDKSRAESLSEALRQPELGAKRVVGFSIVWNSAGISLELGMRDHSVFDKLDLSTGPEDSPDARQLFAAVRDKVTSDDFAPPYWHRLWRKYGRGAAFLSFFSVLLFVWIGGTVAVAHDRPDRSSAIELLDGGIDPAEQSRATELLLRKAYDIPERKLELVVPRWFKWAVLVGLLVVPILAASPPRLELGIGRGKNKIKWWRRWIKFGGVTIPIAALSQLWPIAWQLVSRLFGL